MEYMDDKYERIEVVGEGTYGQVYKARNRHTGDLVALKKMKLDHEDEGIPSTTIREVAALKETTHPNIVSLLDVKCNRQHLYLVFEYVNSDLKRYMKNNTRSCVPHTYCTDPLPAATVKSFLYQALLALDFCHSRRIFHRDLKPQNILIGNNQELKLADFGLARAFGLPVQTCTHEVITLWYRAPEILLGIKRYSLAVDMWSMGCIFYEMASGKPLFSGDSEIDTLFKIFRSFGTPTGAEWEGVEELDNWKPTFPKWTAKTHADWSNLMPGIGEEGVNLFIDMMKFDPGHRIYAKHALQHRYFDELDKSKFKPPADSVQG